MNISTFSLATCLSVALLMCGCQREPHSQTTQISRTPIEWNTYFSKTVNTKIHGARNVYAYILPVEDADAKSAFGRNLMNASADIDHGDVDGALIAFASPDPDSGAKLAIESLAHAKPGSLKNARVLYIGSEPNRDRVAAAAKPSGATFEFAAIQ